MQQIVYSVALKFSSLSRLYRFILKFFTIFALAIFAWQLCTYLCYTDLSSIVKTINFGRSKAILLSQKVDNSINKYMQEVQYKPDDKINSEINTYEHVISSGNMISSISNQLSNINNLAARYKGLHNLKTSQQQFSWTFTTITDLQRLTWAISCYKTNIYNRSVYNLINNNIFKMSTRSQQGDWVNRVMKGTIGVSFVTSAREVGLTNNEINAVIKAMQWQIDFRKLKKGDQFSVLISQNILDRELKQNQLIGVHLRSGSRDYYAIRAEDGKFYDRDGTGLRGDFLRFPTIKQFRISSDFNLHRLNPVTGRIMPHRGIDFAMPQGTPVLAVGDGEVVTAKRSGTAGFYIAVRHGHTYMTRYMHLRKLLVKPGQKVKRGDHIALSGNTGRSTGPHLHYEVWINQQAVNPLNVRLSCNEGLTGKDRYNYLAQVKEVIPKLCFD